MSGSQAQAGQSRKTTRTLPWWLHILLAILVYAGGKYLLPVLSPENIFLDHLLRIAPIIAPIGAIVFLLLAANALYASDPVKKDVPSSQEDDEEDEIFSP